MNVLAKQYPLTQDKLKKYLNYNEDTGIFTRKIKVHHSHEIGDICQSKCNQGYLRIGIDGSKYFLHRLAWLYVTGENPIYCIDHINGDILDNRIVNLRDVPIQINSQNQRKAGRSNTSKYLGVTYNKKSNKWQAQIRLKDKNIYIGLFNNPEDAHQAYLKEKRILHEGCTI